MKPSVAFIIGFIASLVSAFSLAQSPTSNSSNEVANITQEQATQEQAKAQKREHITEAGIFTTPLLERYVLDELLAIRKDQLKHEASVAKELANRELKVSDRAIGYTTDTVNNIFFIITAAATILVVTGLNSLRDVKQKVEEMTEMRTGKLAIEYERRLNEIEEELKNRSTEILFNQEQIAEANQIHSLWMRAGIETNSREKIRIYDEILMIRNDDFEALTYKADAAIELEEFEWALKLCNQAIDLDNEFSLAYWQRACALTGLEEFQSALEDIQHAIEINPSLKDGLYEEEAFSNLHDNEQFQVLASHTS